MVPVVGSILAGYSAITGCVRSGGRRVQRTGPGMATAGQSVQVLRGEHAGTDGRWHDEAHLRGAGGGPGSLA